MSGTTRRWLRGGTTMTLSIKWRLSLGFAGLVLAVSAVGGVGAWGSLQLSDSVSAIKAVAHEYRQASVAIKP